MAVFQSVEHLVRVERTSAASAPPARQGNTMERIMPLSRRHFLATPAALPLFAASQASRPGQAWYRKMRRCGQVNFNEMDPGRLDIAQWVDYWSSLKLDALLLNAGGIMAFYPTKIPGHHRSQFLGDGDLFGDFTKAAKARGMRVVARPGLQPGLRGNLAASSRVVRALGRRPAGEA